MYPDLLRSYLFCILRALLHPHPRPKIVTPRETKPQAPPDDQPPLQSYRPFTDRRR